MSSRLTLLGQSGVRLALGDTVFYIDPYLTDYVFEVEQDESLRRLTEVPVPPDQVDDADFVLVTHAHMDHCDPTTIGPIAHASPRAKIVCPGTCRPVLQRAGIDEERLITATEAPLPLGAATVRAVAAAHPTVERDDDGHLKYVGYVLSHEGEIWYHAGDTAADQTLIDGVKKTGPVDVAILPVNEQNFFRARRNIIGNMSVREAYQLAEEIEAQTVVPVHWDMFAPNAVHPEEIELLYRLLRPRFRLNMTGEGL